MKGKSGMLYISYVTQYMKTAEEFLNSDLQRSMKYMESLGKKEPRIQDDEDHMQNWCT